MAAAAVQGSFRFHCGNRRAVEASLIGVDDARLREVYAGLLDDGRYLCSIATMYRLLRAVGESRERRAQRRHPRYAMPRLVAAAPNQVWSWDITKLGGPAKWLYFSLYVAIARYLLLKRYAALSPASRRRPSLSADT